MYLKFDNKHENLTGSAKSERYLCRTYSLQQAGS
jgi:hypothetical protein